MEEVGCGHLRRSLVQIFATVGRGGHRDRGGKETDVPESGPPAVAPDLIGVEGQDLVEGQELRVHLLSETSEHSGVGAVDLGDGPTETRGAPRSPDR